MQDGYVTFKTKGEVAIIAHYSNLVANVRLTHLVDVPGFMAATCPRQSDRRGRFRETQPDADQAFRRLHEPHHPSGLPRRDWRIAGPKEVSAFLADSERKRRDLVIDPLLNRPEYSISGHEVRRYPSIERTTDREQGSVTFSTDGFANPGPQRTDGRVCCASFSRPTARPSAIPRTNYYRISRDPENGRTTRSAFPGRARIQCASAIIIRLNVGLKTITTALPRSSPSA